MSSTKATRNACKEETETPAEGEEATVEQETPAQEASEDEEALSKEEEAPAQEEEAPAQEETPLMPDVQCAETAATEDAKTEETTEEQTTKEEEKEKPTVKRERSWFRWGRKKKKEEPEVKPSDEPPQLQREKTFVEPSHVKSYKAAINKDDVDANYEFGVVIKEKQFYLEKDVVFLNHGSFGTLPKDVLDKMQR